MKNNQNDQKIFMFALADPDTELSQLIDETLDLAKKDPEILELIHEDQEILAKKRKKKWLEDKQWLEENHFTPFPVLGKTNTTEINEEDLVIKAGKPRMQPLVVLLFIVLRGFLGGIKTKPNKLFIRESMTIQNFLTLHHLQMPGWSTITDNIDCVSNDTLSHIYDSQLRMVLDEGLDDFLEVTIDSTAVSGNTAWPTDSGIIAALTARLWHYGQKLKKFGVPGMRERRFPNIIGTIKKHHQKISMLNGKKGDKARRKKYYRIILKEARKALKAFNEEYTRIEEAAIIVDILPSKKHQLIRIIELIKDDIGKLEQVIGYCDERINLDKTVPSKEKIMSLSDKDAAYIAKGNREEVIGYKPQLGRSKKGFITALEVPQGNTADSSELVPMVDQHIDRTNVIPKIVSVDDGYASAKGKKEVMERGVNVVSISGSKGKKITPLNEWESDEFKEIRANRSAVESLMFTIKYNYSFGKAARREIERVRAEMLGKVIAYNLSRTIEIRDRLKEENRKAAA